MINDNKRILDKDFENGIVRGAEEFRRDTQKGMKEFQRDAQTGIDGAQKYTHQKNDEVEALIREHPKSYVLGSFIGGVLLGTLLSRGK